MSCLSDALPGLAGAWTLLLMAVQLRRIHRRTPLYTYKPAPRLHRVRVKLAPNPHCKRCDGTGKVYAGRMVYAPCQCWDRAEQQITKGLRTPAAPPVEPQPPCFWLTHYGYCATCEPRARRKP